MNPGSSSEDLPPTQAEIDRIYRWQCKKQGHSYTVVDKYNSVEPIFILCTKCNSRWDIAKDE